MLVLVFPANAKWVLLGSDLGGGANFYVDPATAEKEGSTRRAWVLVSFSTPYKKTGARSVRTWEAFNCDEGRNRILEQQSFAGPMATGGTTDAIGPGPWIQVSPKTAGMATLKFVCALP